MRRPDSLSRTPFPYMWQGVIILNIPSLEVRRHRDWDMVAAGLGREGVVFPIRLDVGRIGEVLRDDGTARDMALCERRRGGEESKRGEGDGQRGEQHDVLVKKE